MDYFQRCELAGKELNISSSTIREANHEQQPESSTIIPTGDLSTVENTDELTTFASSIDSNSNIRGESTSEIIVADLTANDLLTTTETQILTEKTFELEINTSKTVQPAENATTMDAASNVTPTTVNPIPQIVVNKFGKKTGFEKSSIKKYSKEKEFKVANSKTKSKLLNVEKKQNSSTQILTQKQKRSNERTKKAASRDELILQMDADAKNHTEHTELHVPPPSNETIAAAEINIDVSENKTQINSTATDKTTEETTNNHKKEMKKIVVGQNELVFDLNYDTTTALPSLITELASEKRTTTSALWGMLKEVAYDTKHKRISKIK